MKPYSNKPDKTDSSKCLYSEIKGNELSRKKAARRKSKKDIRDQINDNL